MLGIITATSPVFFVFNPRVGSDNYNGSMMAIEKLLELGCRHPVYIRFHSIFPGESDKRKDGYLAACKKFHITPDFLDMEDCDNLYDRKLRQRKESHLIFYAYQ